MHDTFPAIFDRNPRARTIRNGNATIYREVARDAYNGYRYTVSVDGVAFCRTPSEGVAASEAAERGTLVTLPGTVLVLWEVVD